MRATVTGGAGFIGSNLVEALLAGGAEVVVIDDFSTGRLANLRPHQDLTVVEGDIRNADDVRRAMHNAEVVFHLAASPPSNRVIGDSIGDSEVNVIGSMQVMIGAIEEGVRKVVASSSAAVYGEALTLPIGEKAPLVPRSPVAASKLAMEHQARTLAQQGGVELCLLRYFNVYGERQHFHPGGPVIPVFARQMLENVPLVVYGDGEQTRDFVHVDDAVAANLAVTHSKRARGVYNIASGIGVTVNEMVGLMAALLRRGVCRHEAGPRCCDVRHSHADISAAWRTFGYRPRVPLAAGLQRYLAWLEDEMAERRATIVVVAGLVGKARPPAADGQPYIKE